MASIPPEELLNRELVDAAQAGDLGRTKECAERLDHGEGLLKTYLKARGPEGLTALHSGAVGGKTHICKYLIEVVGLDVNMKDGQGETVLNHAIRGLNHETVAYLISKGADVNLANDKGYAALHIAAEKGLKEVQQLLLSNGADIEAPSPTGTPLLCAAIWGKKEALEILLDNHANPNATRHLMFSPLMMSIVLQTYDCINLLLKAGADPNLKSIELMPLELAASGWDAKSIKILLQAGANPNVTNPEDMTPLEAAALVFFFEGVMILLPKTLPRPTIPDWTVGGIMKSVHSQEAKNQRVQKRIGFLMESKSKGAEALKNKDYHDALFWYTRAHVLDPRDATLLSNRSLCWACLNNGTEALSDADACIALKPNWSEAYYRKGVACGILKDFNGAAGAYAFAMQLEPRNEEIDRALMDILKHDRLRKA